MDGIKTKLKILDKEGIVTHYIVEFQHNTIKLTAFEYLKLVFEGYGDSEEY